MSSIKPKTGPCLICNTGTVVPLIGKLCQRHYWESRRRPVEAKPRKPIPKLSKTQKERLAGYGPEAKQFKLQNPICQVKGCTAPTDDVHHSRGRIGPLLLDKRYWLAVCRLHHCLIEANPEWAKQEGYSFSRLSK